MDKHIQDYIRADYVCHLYKRMEKTESVQSWDDKTLSLSLYLSLYIIYIYIFTNFFVCSQNTLYVPWNMNINVPHYIYTNVLWNNKNQLVNVIAMIFTLP